MSYTPTEWESTDVVTATRMNALEQAVGDMNMSYTPNTWSDGDILSAEKMNALEQAVASGGGGSSDFSTATVTGVSDSFLKGAKVTGSFVFEDEPGGAPPTLSCEVEIYGGDVVLFALYKGSATVRITSSYTISVSGNITDLEYDNLYDIAGDCTITIS